MRHHPYQPLLPSSAAQWSWWGTPPCALLTGAWAVGMWQGLQAHGPRTTSVQQELRGAVGAAALPVGGGAARAYCTPAVCQALGAAGRKTGAGPCSGEGLHTRLRQGPCPGQASIVARCRAAWGWPMDPQCSGAGPSLPAAGYCSDALQPRNPRGTPRKPCPAVSLGPCHLLSLGSRAAAP